MLSLTVALGYLAFELWSFGAGQRGHLRGAIIFAAGSIFAASLLFPRSRIAKASIAAALLLSLAGAVDFVLHAPGSSLLGFTPRFLDDFNIHSDAAAKIYREGTSPYSPAVNNFPLPTYPILWASSGFGRWDREHSGIMFTVLNLGAGFLTILMSVQLARIPPPTPTDLQQAWIPAAVALFLILNTPVWANIMMGQTPMMAACCIFTGLWLSRLRDRTAEILSGIFLALGIMIKPNFSPFLAYFLAAWVKDVGHHHGRILAYCLSSFIASVLISLILPGGISLTTYSAFGSHISPALERLNPPRNISLVGALAAVMDALPRKLVSALLIGTLAGLIFAFEHRRRRNLLWPVWLVVPLLASPATWSIYVVMLLPAQLLLARHLGSDQNMLNSMMLIISGAMLGIMHPFAGAAGLMLTLYLTLQVNLPIRAQVANTAEAVGSARAHFARRDVPAAAR